MTNKRVVEPEVDLDAFIRRAIPPVTVDAARLNRVMSATLRRIDAEPRRPEPARALAEAFRAAAVVLADLFPGPRAALPIAAALVLGILLEPYALTTSASAAPFDGLYVSWLEGGR